jgi:hypothetical protein
MKLKGQPAAKPPRDETGKLTVLPVTPDRWDDFEKLFGKSGACAGCWCMWWRLPPAQWTEQKATETKRPFANS